MNIKPIIAFTIGAALGGAVSYFFTRKHYADISQREIDEVKASYGLKYAKDTSKDEETKPEAAPEPDKSSIDDYKTTVRMYMSPDMKAQKETPKTQPLQIAPVVIPPDEFGENEAYDHRCWTYYADGVLESELGMLVEDVEETVGLDYMNHFGEYQNDGVDVVYVRNDFNMTYYEIERCDAQYSDVNAVPDEDEED